MTDFSIWRAIPRVRHSKFASNCGVASNVVIREFAVRHAIRQLAIPADAYPVEAELLYQVRETAPPGQPPADPMKPPVPADAPDLPVPEDRGGAAVIHPIRAWNAFFFTAHLGPAAGGDPDRLRPAGDGQPGLLRGRPDLLVHRRRPAPGRRGPGRRRPLAALAPALLQDPTSARVAFALTATAAFFLTIGWRTRLMSILFYLGMLSIHNRNLVSSSGADVLLMTFAFNLMLCPCGAAYSVDAWLAVEAAGDAGRAPDRALGAPADPDPDQPGLHLRGDPEDRRRHWMNGSALHYVLGNTEVRRFDLTFLHRSTRS